MSARFTVYLNDEEAAKLDLLTSAHETRNSALRRLVMDSQPCPHEGQEGPFCSLCGRQLR